MKLALNVNGKPASIVVDDPEMPNKTVAPDEVDGFLRFSSSPTFPTLPST